MEIETIWPLFGLEIETPRLLLRPVRDEDLPHLVQAALDGVHEPDRTPFGVPWTDAPPADLPRALAAYQWSLRNRVTPTNWTVAFAVHYDGKVIGSQDLSASDYENRLTVNTGSWLTKSAQGKGLGEEMRAGVLLFAFDTLGALWAESEAVCWNERSLGVSCKLGYELNGITRVSPRSGQPVDEQKVRLVRERFNRPSWATKVRGAEAALTQLGVKPHRL